MPETVDYQDLAWSTLGDVNKAVNRLNVIIRNKALSPEIREAFRTVRDNMSTGVTTLVGLTHPTAPIVSANAPAAVKATAANGDKAPAGVKS